MAPKKLFKFKRESERRKNAVECNEIAVMAVLSSSNTDTQFKGITKFVISCTTFICILHVCDQQTTHILAIHDCAGERHD